jgi:hypothetical protein
MPSPGSPPFEYRPAFQIAGWRPVSEQEQEEARGLFLRRNAPRRLGLHKIGSFWFCRHHNLSGEPRQGYAEGIYASEMADARALIRDGRSEWAQVYRVEQLPDGLMLAREDQELLARILAKSPGKNRGRPPIGELAMTDAERKRRSRKTLPPQERHQPGIVVPVPLGPAVPGIFNAWMEIEHMVTKYELGLASQYHERLGDLLDKLAGAPPDYVLTWDEFKTVAAAAILHQRSAGEVLQ